MKPGEHGQLWYAVLRLGSRRRPSLRPGGCMETPPAPTASTASGVPLLACSSWRWRSSGLSSRSAASSVRHDHSARPQRTGFSAQHAGGSTRTTLRWSASSRLKRCRRLTAVVTWGAATGLAFLLCARQPNITLDASRPGRRALGHRHSGPTCWSPALSSAQVQSRCMTWFPRLSAARSPSPGSDRTR